MDIVCYSHLRWNFVYQRPQHLMSRMAQHFRVIYIEEPVFDSTKPYLDNQQNEDNVWVIVPHLPAGLDEMSWIEMENSVLATFFDYFKVKDFIAWYYTPMALGLNPSFKPLLTVFDCMDELAAFKNAPLALLEQEKALLAKAGIVFTGGRSLYDAKKNRHPNTYLFPSSIDRNHFGKARSLHTEMMDQMPIPHPRIGFAGVIDERMDIELLQEMAANKPEYQFILIGPVVKINPDTLPRLPNIHYLGPKAYKELPYYIAGWDVAMMPFALNEATRFISPTKTPEYLAAGKPVVSTPIHDVVEDYGKKGLVYIADTAAAFISEIQNALQIVDKRKWLMAVDDVLCQHSWDTTAEKMVFIINMALDKRDKRSAAATEDVYV